MTVVPLFLAFIIGGIFAGGMLATAMSGALFIMPIFMLFGLLFIIIAIWAKAALLFTIKDSEEKIGIRESFKRSKKYIAPYFLVSILVGLVSFGGVILFIIPGIIVCTMVMFSLFVLVCEDVRGMDALAKSREYIRGQWLPVFGRVLLIALIFLVLSMIPLLGAFISMLFLTPFMMVYIYTMYKNLKEIRGEITLAQTSKSNSKKIFTALLVFSIIVIPLFIIFGASMPFLFGK